jgi:hypothetical protein
VDRVIIQVYMLFVLCSIIFLLVVNNPPESLSSSPARQPETNSQPSATVNSH